MRKILALFLTALIMVLLCVTITAAADSPIAINNEAELKSVSQNGNYYLAKDITLSGDFTPIPLFSGTLDGRGKKIINLKISKSAGNETCNVGLFEKIDGGTVKNLTLENVEINFSGGKTAYVGAICGSVVTGSISNCRVGGEIKVKSSTATALVGGVVGRNAAKVNLCENSVAINVTASKTVVGGVVGNQTRSDYPIEKCVNFGNLTVSGNSDMDYVGGVVGKTVYNVVNCANYGVISLDAARDGYVGGIVASLINGEINNCFNGGSLGCEARTEELIDPIAPEHKNKFSNNFYLDVTVSNLITSNVKTASALDRKSLTKESIFKNFDFENVWKIGENGPVLKCITAAEITAPQQSGNEGNTSSAVSGNTSSSTSGTSFVNGTSTPTLTDSQTTSSAENHESTSTTTSNADGFKKKTMPLIWIIVVIVVVAFVGASVFIWLYQSHKSR